MKVLHLTLKKEWFDMILSGDKKEEYRDMKPYWFMRLGYWDEADRESGYSDYGCTEFDVIRFKNGYAADAPTMDVEFEGFRIGQGTAEWGAEQGKDYFCIALGPILSTKNIPA